MNENDKPTIENQEETNIAGQPNQNPAADFNAPADALSRTPDDLAEEAKSSQKDTDLLSKKDIKKVSKIKQFLRKINVYFLFFLIVAVVTIAIMVVSYLNSQKEPVQPTINSQELTEDTLRQLANADASIGGSTQTMTIKGNAIIDGQTLMRGNLNVAGNFQTGGSIQGPSLTISGSSNLGETQINSLQVANNTALQGNTTLRDLSVSGSSTFSGPMTASQMTVTQLTLSGNASLNIPNHISFTGPSPNRSINSTVLGSGGTASVNGSDTTGTINVNTGNGPQAGCFIRINFNQRFSNQPHVIISPVGNAAGQSQYYVDRDQSGFSLCVSSPSPANQAFAFDYFVTN